jgi:hypothetical protein
MAKAAESRRRLGSSVPQRPAGPQGRARSSLVGPEPTSGSGSVTRTARSSSCPGPASLSESTSSLSGLSLPVRPRPLRLQTRLERCEPASFQAHSSAGRRTGTEGGAAAGLHSMRSSSPEAQRLGLRLGRGRLRAGGAGLGGAGPPPSSIWKPQKCL